MSVPLDPRKHAETVLAIEKAEQELKLLRHTLAEHQAAGRYALAGGAQTVLLDNGVTVTMEYKGTPGWAYVIGQVVT